MIMDRYKLDLVSAGRNFDKIRRAICSGYFFNCAKKDPQEGYKDLLSPVRESNDLCTNYLNEEKIKRMTQRKPTARMTMKMQRRSGSWK